MPGEPEELTEFETDVLAGFVLARSVAGLSDTTISSDDEVEPGAGPAQRGGTVSGGQPAQPAAPDGPRHVRLDSAA